MSALAISDVSVFKGEVRIRAAALGRVFWPKIKHKLAHSEADWIAGFWANSLVEYGEVVAVITDDEPATRLPYRANEYWLNEAQALAMAAVLPSKAAGGRARRTRRVKAAFKAERETILRVAAHHLKGGDA